MPVRYESTLPSRDAFFTLFSTTGWNDEYHLTPDELFRAITASRIVVAAYEADQLVGFGRVVTDGVLHAMIYDLIVAPDHRQQGVGGEILARLIRECRAAGIRDIQLFCARGKRAFYERRGFRARPDDAPGMEYAPQP